MRYRVKPIKHDAVRCDRDPNKSQLYSGGGVGYSRAGRWACPTCGRTEWFDINHLGSRQVYCDGQRFTKVKE